MPSYVVTGASRGLGYGWLTRLASVPGNTVIGTVRDVHAVQERLARDGINNMHLLHAEITSHTSVLQAAEETAQITGGALDVLIHNAALVSERAAFSSVLDEADPQAFEDDLVETFKANVVGTAHVLNAFLPLIRKGKDKKIAVISTGLADLEAVREYDFYMATPYSVSKAATNLLVGKYHAAVGRKEGILVFSLSPGFVDTSEGKQKELSEEQGVVAGDLVAKFKEYEPSFSRALTVEESVSQQLELLNRATVEQFGGAFVSHHGDKRWL